MAVAMFAAVGPHLAPGGRLLFPVISLSNERRILDAAHAAFREVHQLAERNLPLPPSITEKDSAFFPLLDAGLIRAEQRRSRWLWQLRIFEATAS